MLRMNMCVFGLIYAIIIFFDEIGSNNAEFILYLKIVGIVINSIHLTFNLIISWFVCVMCEASTNEQIAISHINEIVLSSIHGLY